MMDFYDKLLVSLAIIYILSNGSCGTISLASGQEASYDLSGTQLEEAGKKANELNYMSNGRGAGSEPNQKLKEKNNYWLELEAQIFISQLLNLIKSILFDLPSQSVTEKCLQFNQTLDNSLKEFKKLIEQTSKEGKLAPKDDELVFKSLIESVNFYFNCMASMSSSSSKKSDDNLRKELMPLSGFMLKLSEAMENCITDGDLSMSKLVPVNTDIILDSIKYELEKQHQPQNNLINQLLLSFKNTNLNVYQALEKAKSLFVK